MKKILKEINYLVTNYGLRFSFSHVLLRILKKCRFYTEVDLIKRRALISLRKFDLIVAFGPFKGMILSKNFWWNETDLGAKLFGQYESHVLKSILDLSPNFSTFIDVGAADGYYAIGLLKSGYFENAICFEIAEKGRQVILENAKLNLVDHKISVFGAADPIILKSIISDGVKALILIDIEGFEFELLSHDLLFALKECVVIVELHNSLNGFNNGDKDSLLNRATKIFNVNYINRSSPLVNDFEELGYLDDDARFLLFSEGRPELMEWVCLTPKGSESAE